MRLQLSIIAFSFLVYAGCQPASQNLKKSADPDAFPNLNADGLILDGYDPVAYFTESKPMKGLPEFRSTYKEATYQFASAEHKQLFDSDPEKYKVLFGGWCGYAVSLGHVSPIDVNKWSIVNGHLVVQHNDKAVRGWNEDVAGNYQKAIRYWPYVSGNGGKQINTKKVDETVK